MNEAFTRCEGCLFAAGAADMVSGIFGTGQPSD
jgi:hypothetical protein